MRGDQGVLIHKTRLRQMRLSLYILVRVMVSNYQIAFDKTCCSFLMIADDVFDHAV